MTSDLLAGPLVGKLSLLVSIKCLQSALQCLQTSAPVKYDINFSFLVHDCNECDMFNSDIRCYSSVLSPSLTLYAQMTLMTWVKQLFPVLSAP